MTSKVGIGIGGWGRAGELMASAILRSDQFKLAAVAEIKPDRRRAAAAELPGTTILDTVDSLAADPSVDVLYIASPTTEHAAGVTAAAEAGKPVVVEKPLATSVVEGVTALRAADAAGVAVIVGATRSFDAPVRAFRELVANGSLGRLVAISNYCATDWLARPRRPEDLDPTKGGGVVFRQGGHQFDVLRYIGGGVVDRVSAYVLRRADGVEQGYVASLVLDDGAIATGLYTGSGGFDSRLLTFGVGELGEVISVPANDPRRAFLPETSPAEGLPPGARVPHFGFTVATFEHGQAVPCPDGVLAISAKTDSVQRVELGSTQSGWDALLQEVAGALAGRAPAHDGWWGLATLEVCEAVHEAARTSTDIALLHQVPVGTPVARA